MSWRVTVNWKGTTCAHSKNRTNVTIVALEGYDTRMWTIYVSGNRNYGPDRRWGNDRFIVLSLKVVSDFLSAFAALDLADSSALVPGDKRYVSCLTFRLGRIKSCHSMGIDLRMILNYKLSVNATRAHRSQPSRCWSRLWRWISRMKRKCDVWRLHEPGA